MTSHVQTSNIDRSVRANRFKWWALRLGLISVAVFWLAVIANTWAEAAESAPADTSRAPAAASADSDNEYSFNWLDPDKKIYVLQNRKYTKSEHVLLSAMIGTSFSNPYRTTLNIDPRFAYYFSEDWGVEAFYTFISNSPNNAYKALVATGSKVLPVIRENKGQLGAVVHWAPWYSKINVFNQILYYDWYFSAGAGTISSEYYSGDPSDPLNPTIHQDLTAFYAGTGQQFHVSQAFVIRWDIMGSFYNALYDTSTGDKAWFSNYNFAIGLGLRL